MESNQILDEALELIERNDFEGGYLVLYKAISRKIYSFDIVINYCNACIKTERFNEVLDALKLAESIENDISFYIHYLYSIVYYEFNDLSNSINHLNLSINLNDKYPPSHAQKGKIFRKSKIFDKAILEFDLAIKLDPFFDIPYYNLIEIYCSDFQRFDIALEYCDKFLQINPNYPEMLFYKGRVYEFWRKWEESILNYSKAIETDPMNDKYYVSRGINFIQNGQLNEAMSDFNSSINLNPSNVFAYANRALIFERLNMNLEAFNDYKKIRVELNSKDWEYFEKKCLNKLKINLSENSSLTKLSSQIKQLKSSEKYISHYTNLNVLKALLFNNSKFRLSNIVHLNDKLEGSALLNSNSSSVNRSQLPFYVGSFTKNPDSTKMWMTYGNGGDGCSIQFDKDFLLNKNPIIEDIYNIAYLNPIDSSFTIDGKTLSDFDPLNSIDYDSNSIINFLVKSSDWQFEEEIRYITEVHDFNTIKFDDTGLYPKHYIEVDVDLFKFINKIVIGPRVSNADKIIDTIYLKFKSVGLHGVEVLKSNSNLN